MKSIAEILEDAIRQIRDGDDQLARACLRSLTDEQIRTLATSLAAKLVGL